VLELVHKASTLEDQLMEMAEATLLLQALDQQILMNSIKESLQMTYVMKQAILMKVLLACLLLVTLMNQVRHE
jgi:hypothetical protein